MRLIPGKRYRLSNGDVMEYAYTGALGLAVVHPPGEPDMQSSIAVDPLELRELPPEPQPAPAAQAASRFDRDDIL